MNVRSWALPAVLLGVIATWSIWKQGVVENTTRSTGDPAEPADNDPKPSLPPVRVIEGSPFVQDYGKEGKTAREDLQALMLLLHDCQLVMKNFDELFLPDNAAIVALLQGGNRDRLAWIPPGHDAVNEKGELTDRWKTPVFFHRESGFRFTLRSAGPDRKMWTGDDVVLE